MADQFESLMSLLGDDVTVRWLITLLHFLWQGAVVGGIAAIAGRLLRGGSARSRYALYSAALLSLPVCVGVTFCVVDVPVSLQSSSQWESPANIPAKSSVLPSQAKEFTTAVQMETAKATDAPVLSERVVRNAATMKAVVAEDSESPSRTSLASLSRAAPWIAVAYVVGVAFFLVRLLTALWGGQRLRTRTVRLTDTRLLGLIADQADRVKLNYVPVVAYCERVAVPTVLGVLRPMILLPVPLMTGLASDDFAAIIRHELAHIRRYDLWMNLLQRVIESLLFFHPVVWFISRRLSVEREVCCDDLVVSSGYEPMHYAGALLRMAELCAISRQPGGLALAATGEKTPLFERRIERLMNWGNTPRLQLTRAGMAGLLITLVSLIAVPGIAHTWAQAQTPGGDSETNVQAQPVPAENKQAGVRTMREPAFRLPGYSNIMSVGFDKNGTELAAVSTYHFATIRRCDVVGKKLKSEITLSSDKHLRPFRQDTFKLSGDRRRMIGATDDFVGIWHTATGELLKKLPFPKKEWEYDCIGKLDCTPDLSVIVGHLTTSYSRTTRFYDARLIVWDGASGNILRIITDKHATELKAIDLSTDGKLLATTNGAGAKVWETSSGKLFRSFPNDNSGRKHPEISSPYLSHVWSTQLSPDGKQLAISDVLGVRLWDTQSGKLLHQLDAPYRYGQSTLVFSKDGQLLARTGTAGKEKGKVVPIWSTQTGEKLFELHTESQSGAFSDDNKQFAVGLSDRQMALAVWQLSGGAVDAERADQPVPQSDKDKVTDSTRYHYRGKKAEEFIDNWKPVWGDGQLGIRYGVALTSAQRRFRLGQRVRLAAFFRNVSDKPLQVDVRPDFFWNTLKVVNAKGVAVEIEKVALLGTIPHYREKLEPGEAVGPFYLNFGLGENPRPGKQNWYPYYKTPVAGKYKLTHALSVKVASPEAGRDETSDDWKGGQLASGTIEFEIVDAVKP